MSQRKLKKQSDQHPLWQILDLFCDKKDKWISSRTQAVEAA